MTNERTLHERAAIAATLSTPDLLARVAAVAGRNVGDPLNLPQDCVTLREQFNLTIEATNKSVFAFNDDGVCASLPIELTQPFGVQHQARRAACIAVASMWTRPTPGATK